MVLGRTQPTTTRSLQVKTTVMLEEEQAFSPENFEIFNGSRKKTEADHRIKARQEKEAAQLESIAEAPKAKKGKAK